MITIEKGEGCQGRVLGSIFLPNFKVQCNVQNSVDGVSRSTTGQTTPGDPVVEDPKTPDVSRVKSKK